MDKDVRNVMVHSRKQFPLMEHREWVLERCVCLDKQVDNILKVIGIYQWKL